MKSFTKTDLDKLHASQVRKRRGRMDAQESLSNHVLCREVTTLQIKPLSVNECWQGRRYKTPAYKAYEKETLLRLPNQVKVGTDKLSLSLTVGFSNKQADIDNIVKPFVDILQKKYGFNDNQIYRMTLIKATVMKGEEFISFSFGNV